MPLLELRSPFPVTTPVGNGYAILVESDAHDMWWTVILDNGAIVTILNNRVKARPSWSHGRGITDPQFRDILDGARQPAPAPSGPQRHEASAGSVPDPRHQPYSTAQQSASGAWHPQCTYGSCGWCPQGTHCPWHTATASDSGGTSQASSKTQASEDAGHRKQ